MRPEGTPNALVTRCPSERQPKYVAEESGRHGEVGAWKAAIARLAQWLLRFIAIPQRSHKHCKWAPSGPAAKFP